MGINRMKSGPTHMTCVLCPKSCIIAVRPEAKGFKISGHKCDRGKEYAEKELINSERTLTTTVKTCFKDFPRLPVKTDKPVPLSKMFTYMKKINSIEVKKRLKPGEAVVNKLPGSDVSLIATDDMTQIQEN
jgi:CxxC motif-containing protein